jgi:hypothetical protein
MKPRRPQVLALLLPIVTLLAAASFIAIAAPARAAEIYPNRIIKLTGE